MACRLVRAKPLSEPMWLIGPLGINFSEILIEIQTFSLTKIRLKMSSAKCCQFRLGLCVLIYRYMWEITNTLPCCTQLQILFYSSICCGGACMNARPIYHCISVVQRETNIKSMLFYTEIYFLKHVIHVGWQCVYIIEYVCVCKYVCGYMLTYIVTSNHGLFIQWMITW